MDLKLKSKAVLITGGSKGMGLACARAFLGEGARVALASRDQANLDRAAKQLAAEGHEVATFSAD
ncbi:MAG: SDR family NAD(P)-dependent oxidoreductase, partial [Betaproteobacteria bacterium]|nr:SDR family NAD(P)-dependent oxidoreductase [Betaproteobacteria bacterium]